MIIQSMGEFESEKNILKRYARRGQCFSTTKYVMTLTNESIDLKTLKDIERNGYNFSDGCGQISQALTTYIGDYFGGIKACAF
jgi:RNA-dependent RNA polymerase